MTIHHYFSLQYSAIQKTVLRHDRLWSIAGISNILAWMNEIELPEIAERHGGKAIVAGGGKFTARFSSETAAGTAMKECTKLLATTLPMLEFQVSKVHAGPSFQKLDTGTVTRNPAIQELNEQKRRFRGYAVSFNPHLKLCEECGEYPAREKLYRGQEKETKSEICRVCGAAFQESRKLSRKSGPDGPVTTLQRVYRDYLGDEKIKVESIKPAADFNDLFPGNDDERKRMAIWFSDLNNMNDKVPVWLKQQQEANVLKTFNEFRDTVVKIIVEALVKTFPSPKGEFLPFRLVVAGGDDLCLVMAEQYILDFTRNISTALQVAQNSLEDSHPLSDVWLHDHGMDQNRKSNPFGFGASFVVTSIHTPFSQIHQVGEDLMSAAKQLTDRQGNSVNWRIMAEEHAVTEKVLSFERPLFIETTDKDKSALEHLAFKEYLTLRKQYKAKISTSHLQQIVAIMQLEKNPHEIDRQLKLLDATEADKSFSPLLHDQRLRTAEGILMPERIATLFELMTITGGEQ